MGCLFVLFSVLFGLSLCASAKHVFKLFKVSKPLTVNLAELTKLHLCQTSGRQGQEHDHVFFCVSRIRDCVQQFCPIIFDVDFAASWVIAFLVVILNQVFKSIVSINLANNFLEDVCVKLFEDRMILNLFEVN